jgi:hypothetical protein
MLETQWLFPAIRSSWMLGSSLRKALAETLADPNLDRNLTPLETARITSALTAFEPVLRADLSVADAYFVTRKGAFDSLVLIFNAEELFPAAMASKVPDAVREVREAGKCLAFEVCTAAGVHVLRALEIVLKAYFRAVTNGEPLPKNRNLGTYIRKLEELKVGGPKVLAVLRQIKDLHRNPLMHPEETLDKEAAISLFGIVISAIGAMLPDIPQPPEQGGLDLAGIPS